MPKFVIERNMPDLGNLTGAQLAGASDKSNCVLRELGPQIQWLHSYVTQDKLYCIYIAPSEELIREHANAVAFQPTASTKSKPPSTPPPPRSKPFNRLASSASQ